MGVATAAAGGGGTRARGMVLRGFILQSTYRTGGGRPVVHVSGCLEGGGGFLVRDRRLVPHFYVDSRDAEVARRLGAVRQTGTERVTLEGGGAVRIDVDLPRDVPPLRSRLLEAGVASHEADIRFAQLYLMEHGIRSALEIRGEGRPVHGTGVVFDEPEIAPAHFKPKLSVLSLDVETDPGVKHLLSVALHGCGTSEVLLLTPDGFGAPQGATPFASETELLKGLGRRIRELDPDVLTGWNVVDFDLSFLARLARGRGVALELGRGPGPVLVDSENPSRSMPRARVPGRVVLDGIALLRGAFLRFDDFSLDAVAKEVLGEGKTLKSRGRASEILRLFREDREGFVIYNRTDARLALEVVERLRLVDLAVERSLLTGLPPDRVSSSIAAFDFLYLSELHKRHVVGPSVSARHLGEPQLGGHLIDPIPGLYRNVVVLDFRSLYPSLIRTFDLDPMNLLGKDASPAEADVIVAPSGSRFRRRKSILGSLLDEIMPMRAEARRAGDEVKSHALKILMNSFYGVLGAPTCRFYDPRLGNAITSFGREMLLWCQKRIELAGRRVLYGDTDSLFVESMAEEGIAARTFGRDLARSVTADLAAEIKERWGVESRLELVFDRLYQRLLLPALRHNTSGARKRYAGLVEGPEGGRVVFTGMEAVRGDWTDLAKGVQRALYARLFADREVEGFLKETVARLRRGELDAQLVYRKSLRKPPESYTSTTPPHVAVARRTGRRRGRVSYVVTTLGPAPSEAPGAPLDYEHYIDRQIRPVAEPVLALLGLDFASAIGAARQLPLF